ncbi:hypothetical protein [Streptococcus ferus]|uniref:hypothetical protein n=1 Tax=Streptococcus ferus TaxID=1345 RepID=UPI0023557E16|nr:hypothetical protein [Streptococcus ferus]
MLPKFRFYIKKENRMILPTEFSQIIFDYHGDNIEFYHFHKVGSAYSDGQG